MTPTSDEAGYCDSVEIDEIGDTNVVIFRQGRCDNNMYLFLSSLVVD